MSMSEMVVRWGEGDGMGGFSRGSGTGGEGGEREMRGKMKLLGGRAQCR